MKKASIHVLLIEELTDLLYELNEVYNLQNEVDCKYQDFIRFRLNRAIGFTADTIEEASKVTGTVRPAKETIEGIFTVIDQEGYVDRADLDYAVEKAKDHIYRIQLAYCSELDCNFRSMLMIIELCLEDIKFYIYGK